MARIIGVAKRADGIERSDTVENIAAGYSRLHNCDPYQDMLFVEIDGLAVGYSRVWWEEQEDGQHVYRSFAFLDPAWRRQGIGQAVLTWDETRLGAIAATHGATPKIFRCIAQGGETGTRALLDANGYGPTTSEAEMARSILAALPEAPLPDGLEIRPVEPGHLRAIWEVHNEAFRDHFGFRQRTESDWDEFLNFPFTDLSLWKVGWEGERIVGQVRSFIDTNENEEYGRLRGYTEFISTIKEWRGRGVAKALICESMRALRDRGMEEAALGVHTENLTGAFHLYSSLGYVVVSTSTVYEKPLH
jgi:ribosomal protein S18 acetylase RimI-like enzyme